MLARTGNSLFWMGRYIERAEHLARYTKVQYASTMDAPLAQEKEFVLGSILNMGGLYQEYLKVHAELNDEEVIHYVTIAEKNPFSILSSIGYMRENARGARDSISSELWETINRFYHLMNKYTSDQLLTEGIYRFSKKVEVNSSVMKGYIDNTLIRDEVWLLLSLGLHLERAIQICLIIQNKVADIATLEPARKEGPIENFHWGILLRSAEAYDMFKRLFVTSPKRRTSLEFLILYPDFPKSLIFNLRMVEELIQKIGFHDQKGRGSIYFMAGKLATQYQYLTIGEVENTVPEVLGKTLSELYTLAHLLEQKYLSI